MERKKRFLVKYCDEIEQIMKNHTPHSITNAYVFSKDNLAIAASDKHPNQNDCYFLSLIRKNLYVSDYLKTQITKDFFLKIIETESYEGNLINKKQYYFSIAENIISTLQIYEGHLQGLMIVEIYFHDANDYLMFKKPNWLLEEVTNNQKYNEESLIF